MSPSPLIQLFGSDRRLPGASPGPRRTRPSAPRRTRPPDPGQRTLAEPQSPATGPGPEPKAEPGGRGVRSFQPLNPAGCPWGMIFFL